MNLSHSASSVSLHNAFAELRQAPMADGPSTAPPIFNQTGPPFPTSLTNVVGSFSGGLSGLPPSSTAAPSSLPSGVTQLLVEGVTPSVTGVSAHSTMPSTVPTITTVSTQPLTTGVVSGVSVSTCVPPAVASLPSLPLVVGMPVAPGTVTSPPTQSPSTASTAAVIPQTLASPPLQLPVGNVACTLPHTSVSAPVMSTVTPAQVQLSSSTSTPSFVESVTSSAAHQDVTKKPAEVTAAISTMGMSLPISAPLTYAGVAASGIAVVADSVPSIHPTHLQTAIATTPIISQTVSTPLASQVPMSGAVPVNNQIPAVQHTLQHGQTLPSTGPGLTHTHSIEGEDSLTKSGIDDIKTLEEKLRSLFSEHGGVGTQHSLTPQEAPIGQEGVPLPGPPSTTISTQTKPTSTAPPTSLPLGQSGMSVLGQGVTPGQAVTPVTYVSAAAATAPPGKAVTPPSKPPLSRVPVSCVLTTYVKLHISIIQTLAFIKSVLSQYNPRVFNFF